MLSHKFCGLHQQIAMMSGHITRGYYACYLTSASPSRVRSRDFVRTATGIVMAFTFSPPALESGRGGLAPKERSPFRWAQPQSYTPRRSSSQVGRIVCGGSRRTSLARESIDHTDVRTRVFLDGHTPEGARNLSAFAASANLLGCGIDEREAKQLILAGAAACGLPEREAKAAFSSARNTLARKRRRG